MTQPGGAATHYGILYQVLSELAHSFRVHIVGPHHDPDAITLTIEPRGGGGDLVEMTTERRRIYQYKARSAETTWSLQQLIDGVFPDLLRAVGDETKPTEFWFVTEGREGELDELWRLRGELAGRPVPEAPMEVLDATRRPFFRSEAISSRELIARIAESAYVKKGSAEEERQRHRHIWLVLAQFHFRTESIADLREDVHAILLGFVDAPERVSHVADELYGYLLQLGSDGSQVVTADRLLRRAGLPTRSLTMLRHAPEVHERLRIALDDLGYQASAVLRRAVSWPDSQLIVAVAGESGQGKTTLLAQLAEETSVRGPVVFVSGRYSANDAMQRAADEVWKRVARHSNTIDLESLAQLALDLQMTTEPHWLTIFLDLSATDNDLGDVLRFRWEKWRIRLAISINDRASTAIEKNSKWRERVALVKLEDFTPQQVRRFLQLRGKSPHAIRTDVLDTLRRPILADIYAQLDRSDDWQPENEYALYDRFWHRIDEAPGQAERNDSTRLLLLADTLLDDDVRYPWPATYVAQRLEDPTCRRLEKAGWLARTNDGDVRFRHERLLNWAIAKAMAERLRTGQWSVQQLGEKVTDTMAGRVAGDPYLGYVAMDVLWLGASVLKSDDSAALLELLEDADHQIYSVVSTLGGVAVPTLTARLRRITDPHAWEGYRASQALLDLDERSPLPADVIRELVMDDSLQLQDVGLQLSRRHPDPSLLDRLWALRHSRTHGEDEAPDRYQFDQRVTDALTEAARQSPEWIRDRLIQAKHPADIATLLVLLGALGSNEGRDMWLAQKAHALAIDGEDHWTAAAHCIERYHDLDETEPLVAWCTHGNNWLPGVALGALASIAPSRALDFLREQPLDPVHWNLTAILRPLALRFPIETNDAIQRAVSDGRLLRREIAFSYGGAFQLDTATIDALIVKLRQIVDRDPDGKLPYDAETSRAAEHIVEALDTVASADGIQSLIRVAQTETGHAIARYAIGRVATSGFFLRYASSVLLKIGGAPLTTFLEARLNHPGRWPSSCIRSIASSPTTTAMRRVHELLASANRGSSGETDSTHQLRQSCIETIAAVEGRDAAIDALRRSGGIVTYEIVALLSDTSPASEHVVSDLVKELAASSSNERATVLTYLGISGRSELVPLIIEVLMSSSESEIYDTARFALRELVTSETPVDDVLCLGFSQFSDLTLELLLFIDTPAALDRMVMELEANPPTDPRSTAAYLAVELIEKKGRTELASSVWRATRDSARFLRDRPPYEAIGHVEDDDAEDFLMARAFGSDDREASVRAVLSLAVRRSDAACEAAERVLKQRGKNRAPSVDVLFEIDPSRAIDFVIGHIPHERNVLVREYIGRALRRNENPTVRLHINSLMSHSDPMYRSAGCELAGWLDDFAFDRLDTAALEDFDPMVRAIAMGAAFAERNRSRVRELLSAFITASGSDAWALMQVIVDTGDPLLVIARGDPLWLGHALQQKPTALAQYAQERVNARWKKFVEDTDKDMRDDYYR